MKFNCKIFYEINNIILLDKDFKNLKEIALELGLNYQQVADLNSNRTFKKYHNFKYFPTIEIKKIK